MEYELYIDVYFMLNFLMDFIILTAAKKLLRNNSSILRRLIGAGIGSIAICVFVVFPIYNRLLHIILVYFAPGIIMTLVAFKPINLKQLVRQVSILFIVAFLLGGSMLAIYNNTFLGYYVAKVISGEASDLISIRLFLVLSIVGTSVLFLFTSFKRKLESYEGIIYSVELFHDGKSTTAIALMDTGNKLIDPISKRPVIICEKSTLEKIVNTNVLEVLTKSKIGGRDMFDALRDYKIRMIPFNAVGNTNGMLVAVTIDSVKITYNQSSITLCETLVAVYDKKLSQTGEFQMLLQPDLLKK